MLGVRRDCSAAVGYLKNADLFSGLMDAAWGELASEATLSDEELIGGHLNW